MNTDTMTHFAPADRLPVEALADVLVKLASMEQFQWLERIPLMIFLTNPYRQIVYCNTPFKRAVRPQFQDELIGMRPGEALGCIHSREMRAGCGCSAHCRDCGAAQAILKSLQGVESCTECHINIKDGDYIHNLDIQVLSRPFSFENHTYSLNTAFDISHERMLFEQNRIFLHSMINAAGGMESLLGMLSTDSVVDEKNEPLAILHKCALSMLQEVLYQYDCVAVSAGKLAVNCRRFDVSELIAQLIDQLHHHALGIDRSIKTSGVCCFMESDPRLVRHILSSLVLNALEGSGKDDVILIRWMKNEDKVMVIVENDGALQPEIRAHLFKLPVSTKGKDRGLGLYHAEKIAREHLKGELLLEELPGKVRFVLKLPNLQQM